ncbi:hypothetical protein BaOVIS_015910 [Babesia ovis]|uniref:Cytochrome c oxidase assembly protein COX14 n=1 Tax=Babesia ovis TaxID=5869 RepID=A0A9W5TA32_BABOV|nr:hypothetical protein BaOVIS_015910 [Babesia ovis]
MKGGARFEIFRALGINYYGFHVRKNKIYDYISVVVCTSLIGTSIYLGVSFVYNWRQSMQLLRYHHARLEVEREGYIKLIKEAREKNLLPPRKT